MPAEKVTAKSENRRSNKPLMEKRRRARINQSLSELKNLILDAMKKDTSRSSKLEKADILEMAVRHLQNLQQQKPTTSPAVSTAPTSDPDTLGVHRTQHQNKYRAGYNECAKEVSRFLDTVDDIDSSVRGRLVAHLLNCLNEMSSTKTNNQNGNNKKNNNCVRPAVRDDDDSGCHVSMDTEPSSSDDTTESSSSSPVSSSDDNNRTTTPLAVPLSTSSSVQPIHIHIPATSIPLGILSNGHHHHHHHHPPPPPPHQEMMMMMTHSVPSPLTKAASSSATSVFHGLQLVPTRLSTGEFAFVVPNSQSCSSSVSTNSAAVVSSSSSSSMPSTPSSSCPVVVRVSLGPSSDGHHHHHSKRNNKSTPLVIKDEPVWRPW